MASDQDLDPDINFMSRIKNCNCKYLLESQLSTFFKFSQPNCVNIMHVNCRSLNKNFKSLLNLLHVSSGKLSALALTETWLTPVNQDTFIIDGYHFFANSRKVKIGGGVGIYVSNDYVSRLRCDLSFMNDNIECIFVEIGELGNRHFIIGCVYRPPNSDITQFNSDLTLILDIINQRAQKLVFLAGDFNLDLIKSDSHAPTSEFLNILTSHSFLPTISLPTRITSTTATLIDNIFTNSIKLDFDTGVVYSSISDHLTLVLHANFALTRQNCSPIFKRFYSPQLIQTFNESLARTNWNEILPQSMSSANPNKPYSMFIEKYIEVFEDHFPICQSKFSKKNTRDKFG